MNQNEKLEQALKQATTILQEAMPDAHIITIGVVGPHTGMASCKAKGGILHMYQALERAIQQMVMQGARSLQDAMKQASAMGHIKIVDNKFKEFIAAALLNDVVDDLLKKENRKCK